MQGRHAVQLRFHRPSFSLAQAYDIGDAVVVRSLSNALQVLELRGVGGDDQLAAALVCHSALGAVGVQALSTLHARARLERAMRVVDPGMDHLRVARARVRADGVFGLENQDLASSRRQGARHREAHQPRADDDRVNAIHEGSSTRGEGRQRPALWRIGTPRAAAPRHPRRTPAGLPSAGKRSSLYSTRAEGSGSRSGQSSRSSRARETASGRVATSSLRKMLLTWVLTVLNET